MFYVLSVNAYGFRKKIHTYIYYDPNVLDREFILVYVQLTQRRESMCSE